MLTCVSGSLDIAGLRQRAAGPGNKAPLYATASGLVFLSAFSPAELDEYFAHTVMWPVTTRTPTTPHQTLELLQEIRAKGYAACDRYLVDGVYSVAAPVFNANGCLVGSILAGVATERLQDADFKTMLVPVLSAAAREIGLNWD
jgi:DNA-binding IclR family transcriptional regulator